MRYLRLAFLAVVGILLLTVALANRHPVTLRLLPEEMAAFLPFGTSVTMPLFLVVLGGVLAGLVIGFVWEWFREHKHRSEAARERRHARELEREVKSLRDKKADGKDDVLALLE
ncbi:LapA family protein [Rhodovulum sp. YNF3179]|uniref:LapA family protein n=1 Tax=Rhodovulum sp. YNF3179 TaxID=3425127 RepID=UPI003D3508C4